ncbi:MAG: anaerobic ribonucleoside-triphosphate reductase activating protein [bacterium]
MVIGGLQKFSLIDYPKKVSAVVFTFGCNFRCHYCHNPELVEPTLLNGILDEEFILDFLKTRINKLDGVTVTGGEPTLHRDLPKFLSKIKELGFLVKLDTNGSIPEMLKELIKDNLLDYIAMDIKAPKEKYRDIIDADLDLAKIGESINLIMSSRIDYEFRTTVVRSLLLPEDILSIAKMIEGSRLFVIQRFISTKTLDPNFINEKSYSDEELHRIQQEVLKLVKNCILR